MDSTSLLKPSIIHAEPVLQVSDIVQTVDYYHEVLAFPEKWTWGEPPNHGGVNWNGAAFIQFSLNPELAKIQHGESVWLRTKHVEMLYEIHQKNNAEIAIPLTNRPWGFTDYTIKDINGYYVTFAEPISEKKKSGSLPSAITITTRIPTLDEAKKLCESVGWTPPTNAALLKQIESASYLVTAEETETNEIIGCAFLLGDNKTCYYIKDVIVHPDWQGRRIGTALMKALMEWLETKGAENATVGLFTGEHLASFYRGFGFTQACGMYQQVRRKVQS